MKLARLSLAAAATLFLLISGCAAPGSPEEKAAAIQSPMHQLIIGNDRYASGHPMYPHQNAERRSELAKGQHPVAIVVSCSDSRVPPEIVFDQGLGDLFVVRTAGNVVDDQALGSIEYAVEHLHTKLIVVLGHENCGAVKATIDGGAAPGHIGSITHAIEPAVAKARQEKGDLMDNAVNENVLLVVNQIKTSGPILSHEVEAGKLLVVGARYDLTPGTVHWLTKP
jgi:carbonic anhydrase